MVRHRRRHLVTGSHHCDWSFSETKVSSLHVLQYFYRFERIGYGCMIAWDGTELSYNHSCFSMVSSMVRVIVYNIIL